MGSEEKLQVGRVVSTKMDKTVVVRIDRHKRHRLYRKTMRVTRRYKAHDETNACNLGDIVRIAETRPISRDKRWRVVEIVTKGDVAEVAPTEIGAHIIDDISVAQAAGAEARAAAEAAKRVAAAAAMPYVEPEGPTTEAVTEEAEAEEIGMTPPTAGNEADASAMMADAGGPDASAIAESPPSAPNADASDQETQS